MLKISKNAWKTLLGMTSASAVVVATATPLFLYTPPPVTGEINVISKKVTITNYIPDEHMVIFQMPENTQGKDLRYVVDANPYFYIEDNGNNMFSLVYSGAYVPISYVQSIVYLVNENDTSEIVETYEFGFNVLNDEENNYSDFAQATLMPTSLINGVSSSTIASGAVQRPVDTYYYTFELTNDSKEFFAVSQNKNSFYLNYNGTKTDENILIAHINVTRTSDDNPDDTKLLQTLVLPFNVAAPDTSPFAEKIKISNNVSQVESGSARKVCTVSIGAANSSVLKASETNGYSLLSSNSVDFRIVPTSEKEFDVYYSGNAPKSEKIATTLFLTKDGNDLTPMDAKEIEFSVTPSTSTDPTVSINFKAESITSGVPQNNIATFELANLSASIQSYYSVVSYNGEVENITYAFFTESNGDGTYSLNYTGADITSSTISLNVELINRDGLGVPVHSLPLSFNIKQTTSSEEAEVIELGQKITSIQSGVKKDVVATILLKNFDDPSNYTFESSSPAFDIKLFNDQTLVIDYDGSIPFNNYASVRISVTNKSTGESVGFITLSFIVTSPTGTSFTITQNSKELEEGVERANVASVYIKNPVAGDTYTVSVDNKQAFDVVSGTNTFNLNYKGSSFLTSTPFVKVSLYSSENAIPVYEQNIFFDVDWAAKPEKINLFVSTSYDDTVIFSDTNVSDPYVINFSLKDVNGNVVDLTEYSATATYNVEGAGGESDLGGAFEVTESQLKIYPDKLSMLNKYNNPVFSYVKVSCDISGYDELKYDISCQSFTEELHFGYEGVITGPTVLNFSSEKINDNNGRIESSDPIRVADKETGLTVPETLYKFDTPTLSEDNTQESKNWWNANNSKFEYGITSEGKVYLEMHEGEAFDDPMIDPVKFDISITSDNYEFASDLSFQMFYINHDVSVDFIDSATGSVVSKDIEVNSGGFNINLEPQVIIDDVVATTEVTFNSSSFSITNVSVGEGGSVSCSYNSNNGTLNISGSDIAYNKDSNPSFNVNVIFNFTKNSKTYKFEDEITFHVITTAVSDVKITFSDFNLLVQHKKIEETIKFESNADSNIDIPLSVVQWSVYKLDDGDAIDVTDLFDVSEDGSTNNLFNFETKSEDGLEAFGNYKLFVEVGSGYATTSAEKEFTVAESYAHTSITQDGTTYDYDVGTIAIEASPNQILKWTINLITPFDSQMDESWVESIEYTTQNCDIMTKTNSTEFQVFNLLGSGSLSSFTVTIKYKIDPESNKKLPDTVFTINVSAV